jgi:hypothetical protein
MKQEAGSMQEAGSREQVEKRSRKTRVKFVVGRQVLAKKGLD